MIPCKSLRAFTYEEDVSFGFHDGLGQQDGILHIFNCPDCARLKGSPIHQCSINLDRSILCQTRAKTSVK